MVRLKIAKVFAGNNFTPAHPGAILVYDITDEDSFHKVGQDHQLFGLQHHSHLFFFCQQFQIISTTTMSTIPKGAELGEGAEKDAGL